MRKSLAISILLVLTWCSFAHSYTVGSPSAKLPPAFSSYAPDAGAADQGVTDTGVVTLKNLIDDIGTSKKATIIFSHTGAGNTTTSTLTTSETIPSNITTYIEPGAIIDGAGTLTINGPFEAGLVQCFGSSVTVAFGSGAVREIYPEWWGTNDSALQKAVNSAYNVGSNIDASLGTTFALWNNIPEIVLSGTYLIDATVYLKMGIRINSQNATLKANSNLDTILAIYESANTYETGYYSQRGIVVSGRLILDGADKANKGLVTRTISDCDFSNITAVRCTRKLWTDSSVATTATTAIKLTTITVDSVSNISVDDVIRVHNGTRYLRGGYIVQSIAGSVLTLTGNLQEAVSIGDTVDNFAVGFLFNGNQNRFDRLTSTQNGVGFVFCQNTSDISRDDNLYTRLLSFENEVGGIVAKVFSSIFQRCTFQHSKYENLIVISSKTLNFIGLYNEPNTDTISVDAETYPLIYLEGNNLMVDVFDQEASAIGWFRRMLIDAENTTINYSQGGASQNPVNPTQAGDYSQIMIRNDYHVGAVGITVNLLWDRRLSAFDAITETVVDEAYAFPSTTCYITSTQWNTGIRLEAGNKRVVDNRTDYYTTGDAQARLIIYDGTGQGFQFGDGTNATDTNLFRAAANTLKTSYSFIKGIGTLANDATPSVAGKDYWLTGGTTTITDFDDGQTGQVIAVIAEHSLDITDGTNIFLSGSANWSMTATDTLTLICKADNKWYEIARSDSGA